MTRAGAQSAALEAIVMSGRARGAGASRRAGAGHAGERDVDHTGARDPLEVPIEDKIALLLATNEAALKVKNVRFVNSGLRCCAK